MSEFKSNPHVYGVEGHESGPKIPDMGDDVEDPSQHVIEMAVEMADNPAIENVGILTDAARILNLRIQTIESNSEGFTSPQDTAALSGLNESLDKINSALKLLEK